MRPLLALAVLSLVATTLAGEKLAGQWKGRVDVDESRIAEITDPHRRKLAESTVGSFGDIRMELSLTANHTFKVIVSGLPSDKVSKLRKGADSEGTWSVKGNVLTLKITRQNGNKVTPPLEQRLKVIAGGKKLVQIVSGASAGTPVVIYTR